CGPSDLGDGLGPVLGRLLGAVVDRGGVVGQVPDLGVDGPGQYQPDVDAGSGQLDSEALGPAAEGERGGAVGRLAGDPDPAGQAGDVDDHTTPGFDQAGQQPQRELRR